MSYEFDTRLGEQLYRLLPEVYRTRDKHRTGGGAANEDLAKYLDAHGYLLDLIHATLEQQLKDTVPGSSQDWLLPYFAQLLAVNIVSPDSEGKHAEVKHAVSWRQRKGTLKCVEEIAESVGRMEVEIQEGWQRVAMTPRIGMPLRPAKVWDDTLHIDMGVPSEAIRHPGLPAVMVDLRQASRAVEALPTNPAARVSNFAGVRQTWRQQNRHGMPCFPGSFDDVSRRTVDFRTPDALKGHYHHKRLLAYTSPPAGSLPFESYRLTWDERLDSLYEHLIEETEADGVLYIRNKTDRVVEITDVPDLDARPYRIEGISFLGVLGVPAGGTLELHRVEAATVDVPTFLGAEEPVLVATDCLFGTLSSPGRVELDSCTVLDAASLSILDARDCIFMQIDGTDISGVVEYSRIPSDAPFSAEDMTVEDCTSDEPAFFRGQTALPAKAVLSPDTPASISAGASDGGELGYFHHGREGRPVRITGDFTAADALSLPAAGGYPLVDVFFEGSVEVASGHLQLVRAAVKTLSLQAALSFDEYGAVVPALDARDCLFDGLEVPNGLARLEYCTVMQSMHAKHLQASDCIFVDSVTGVQKPVTTGGPPSFLNCVRYSSLPRALMDDIADKDPTDPLRRVAEALRLIDKNDTITLGSNTLEGPVFTVLDYCVEDGHERRTAEFGEPGYGVLHPATADAVRFGAEDGGEMGAWHHKHYSLKEAAALDKMREFLPVGIEPVLIHDPRLLRVPPELTTQE